MPIDRIIAKALVAATIACAAPSCVWGQTLFLCEDGGRSFAVLGEAGAPGCQALAHPERDLQLSPAQPDLGDIARRLSAQSARIDRLEQLLLGRRPSASPRARPSPRTDTFDTHGRMRDLGQDLDRALDDLGR